jgi:hypothetical protein
MAKKKDTFDGGGEELSKDWANDLFNDPATEPKSAYFQFEKVGDMVAGELTDTPFEKEGKFGFQTIYPIRTKEGTEMFVALKNTTHKIQVRQLRSVEVGDMVAFRFEKEVDTGKVNPAKSISVRIRHKEG